MKFSKAQIENFISEGKTLRQIQKELNCSYKTLKKHIIFYNIDITPRRKCKYCNKLLKGNKIYFCGDRCKFNYYYHNKKNKSVIDKSKKQVLVGQTKRKKLVELFGGKCSICGYDKNMGALTFHHKDSSTKKFGISGRLLTTKNMEELIEEANKCVLLCHNCHMEVHYPHLNDWKK